MYVAIESDSYSTIYSYDLYARHLFKNKFTPMELTGQVVDMKGLYLVVGHLC